MNKRIRISPSAQNPDDNSKTNDHGTTKNRLLSMTRSNSSSNKKRSSWSFYFSVSLLILLLISIDQQRRSDEYQVASYDIFSAPTDIVSLSEAEKEKLRKLVLSRQDDNIDGPIYGNPLQNGYCKNSLLEAHGYNKDVEKRRKLYKKTMLDPYFVSREVLDAMTQKSPSRQQYSMKNMIRSNWIEPDLSTDEKKKKKKGRMMMMMMGMNSNIDERKEQQRNSGKSITTGSNNDANSNVTYVMLGKCASSSIAEIFKMLEEQNDETYEEKRFQDFGKNKKFVSFPESECTFTFVRDPIKRVISAYSTINSLLSKGLTNIYSNPRRKKIWSFVDIKEEPKRFKAYVNDLLKHPNEFTSAQPFMHVFSQTGKLGFFSATEFHFIGKVESFDKHFLDLSQNTNDACTDFFGSINPEKLPHANQKSSARAKHTRTKVEDDISTRYDVIFNNQVLFNRLIEHYWQDYVCFGYDINYNTPEYQMNYTGKFQYPFSKQP